MSGKIGPSGLGPEQAVGGTRANDTEALREIFGVFERLDGAELIRMRDFARALQDRADDEMVFYCSRPTDLHISEAFFPADSLESVWRGKPRTCRIRKEATIEAPAHEPVFFEPQKRREDYVMLMDVKYVPSGKGDAPPSRRYDVAREGLAQRKQRLAALGDRNEERLRRLREEVLTESVPVSRAARLIGRSEQTAINRAGTGDMLGFRDGVRWMFPLWQFDATQDGGTVRGLREVQHALEIPAFSSVLWFRRATPALDGRAPRDVLRAGEIDRVVALARSVGAQ